MDTKTYTLRELAGIDIDAWVEGISHMAEEYATYVDGFKLGRDCPAEFEEEFTALADSRSVRFDAAGNIVSDNGKEIEK